MQLTARDRKALAWVAARAGALFRQERAAIKYRPRVAVLPADEIERLRALETLEQAAGVLLGVQAAADGQEPPAAT